MKKIFTPVICLWLYSSAVLAQNVGIGTTSPNTSAALDISNTAKGLLIPRMTSTGITAIANPAKGLMVYDTLKSQLMVNLGTQAAPNWQTIVAKSGWGLNGNSGINPANNFIGTTDNQPLIFKVAGQEAGRIDSFFQNTSIGYGAATNYSDVYLSGNTAIGFKTLYTNQVGVNNTAVGNQSLFANRTGRENTAIGAYSLSADTAGDDNTAVGTYALISQQNGFGNTATGYETLQNNLDGHNNTANGIAALNLNTHGSKNTAVGTEALFFNITGNENTAVGEDALLNCTGNYNTAIGSLAIDLTTAAYYNTAVGYSAGHTYDNGYNNVFLGANTDVNGPAYYNVIAIGQRTICTGSSQVTIGNSATGSYRAYANWSNISDGRFKKNIQENVPGLDFITQLRPVTYNLNATGLDAFLHKDITGTTTVNQKTKAPVVEDAAAKAVYNKALNEKESVVYTGFVAQEVETTAKKMGFNFSGIDAPKNENDVYGLRYAEFVVPLVKAVQEQQQQIELLKQQNALLLKRVEILEKKN